MSYLSLLNAPVAWSSSVQYKRSMVYPAGVTGYEAVPVVTNSGITYYANGSSIPVKGTAPASDTAWSILVDPTTSAEVLAAPLTGYTATAGALAASSTVLQAFQNLGFATYGYIKGFSGSGISSGAITINNGTSNVSSNLTLNATSVSLPLNKVLKVEAVIEIVIGSGGGVELGITAANATVYSQAVTLGSSSSGQRIGLSAIVVTTTTATPTVSVFAGGVSGAVDYGASSVLQINALTS